MGFASTFLIFFGAFFGDAGGGLGVPASARLAAASAASCLRRCATTAAAVAAILREEAAAANAAAQNATTAKFFDCRGRVEKQRAQYRLQIDDQGK